jgi:hypothetical protein
MLYENIYKGINNEKKLDNILYGGVLRTGNAVGDGSANSEGILINKDGLYACEANQTLDDANVKILQNGSAYFKGQIESSSLFVGDENSNMTFDTTNGLVIADPQICDILETYENIERGDLIAINSYGMAMKTNVYVDLSRFYGIALETVNRMDIVNGGTGYSGFLYPLNGGNYDCVIATTTDNGVVVKIEVINAGTGYTEGQDYHILGGNNDCIIKYKNKNYIKVLKSGLFKTTGLTAGKKYRLSNTYSDTMTTSMNNYIGQEVDFNLGVGGIVFTKKLKIYQLRVHIKPVSGAGTYPYTLSFYPCFVSEGGYLADEELTPTSVTLNGSVGRITTTRDLKVGDYIYIYGCEQEEYNGWKKITFNGYGYGEFNITGTPASPATGTIKFKHRPVKDSSSSSLTFNDSNPYIISIPKNITSSTIYNIDTGDAMGYPFIFEFYSDNPNELVLSVSNKSAIPENLKFNRSSDLYIGMVKDDTKQPFYRLSEYSASGDIADGTGYTTFIFGIARDNETLMVDKTILK